ncbi:MAG TPA: hypothetical protein PLS49_01795 [Candidatus Woesebacteria bacterium]|nr:hypothetical protein [Candidatus Woesebacteria bacterium]
MSVDQQERSMLEKVRQSRTLEQMNIEVTNMEEIPFADEVQYVTLGEAFQNYLQDPYGVNRRAFLQNAFGIEDVSAFYKDAGLEEYENAKQKGACVGAIKSHTLQTTPYNILSDIAANSLIAQKYGVPTAIMAISYETDTFHTSPEKMEAFGPQRYFIGYDAKGKEQFTTVNVRATSVRESDGSIRNISVINEASGYSLKDIFITVTDPLDAKNANASICDDEGNIQEFLEVALGTTWEEILENKYSNESNPGMITVTQFHRVMFEKTLDRLRSLGYIPDAETMPIIYSDISKVSDSLLKHATRNESTLTTLGMSGSPQEMLAELLCTQPHEVDTIYEYVNNMSDAKTVKQAVMAHHDRLSDEETAFMMDLPDSIANSVLIKKLELLGLSFDSANGLLKRGKTADPGAYYPVFSSMLDIDCTSLNEDSWFFTGKIKRCQNLQRQHKLPISTIRIPHNEIEDFDTIRVHPTGRIYDIKSYESAVYRNHIATLPERPNSEQIQEIKLRYMREFYEAMRNNPQSIQEYERLTDAIATDPILAWWATLVTTLPEEI